MEIGKEYQFFDGDKRYTGIYKGIDKDVGGVNFLMTCENPYLEFEEDGESIVGFTDNEERFQERRNCSLVE